MTLLVTFDFLICFVLEIWFIAVMATYPIRRWEMAEKALCLEINKVLIRARNRRKFGGTLLLIVDKIGRGKKLKSHEFLQVHAIIWQAGPIVKYEAPHKWERVTRDGWSHE